MIVACPKCATPQDVGNSIAPEGTRVGCGTCGVKFVVRRAATMAMSAGGRYYVRRKTGNSFGPFVEGVITSMLGQRKLDGTEEVSQDGKSWSPIGTVPAFAQALAKLGRPPAGPPAPSPARTAFYGAGKNAGDLPAPREAVPRVADLPAPREAVPRVADLPAPREAVPHVDNLPAPVNAGTAPSKAAPLTFDDFTPAGIREDPDAPTSRQEVSDLPRPREPLPRPAASTPGLDLPTPKAPKATKLMTPTPSVAADLDLGLAPDDDTALAPASRAAGPPPPGGTLPFERSRERVPAPGLQPLARDPDLPSPASAPAPSDLGLDLGAGGSGLSLDLPSPLADGQAGGTPDGDLPSPLHEQPSPAPPDLGLSFDPAPPVESAAPAGESFDLGLNFDPASQTIGDTQPTMGDDPTRGDGQDLGEGAAPPPDSPELGQPPLAEGEASAPPSEPEPPAAKPRATPRKRSPVRLPRSFAIGMVAVLGLGGAGAVVVLSDLPAKILAGPDPSKILGPVKSEIARDQFPAYLRGAKLLASAAAGHARYVRLRAAAAELYLDAVVIHGAGPAELGQAQALLDQIPKDTKTTREIERARALMALAQHSWKDAERRLGKFSSGAFASLVRGLRMMGEGSYTAAAPALSAALAADPNQLAVQYSLARAWEQSGDLDKAGAAYKQVSARSRGHFGAALGEIRVASLSPADRLAQASELVGRDAMNGSKAEVAEAWALVGQSASAEGKRSDADSAFDRALASDPHNVTANLVRGTALLDEGRFPDALARFQAIGPDGGHTLDGRFGLAGALIGSGKTKEGLAALQTAMAEAPKDPRGPCWMGRAAELQTPPDLDAAAKSYSDALALDHKFIPAATQLASALVRQSRAPEALATLKAAEEAGAPTNDLQVALGQALLASHDPASAKAAFRKALDVDPKLEAARLGLAATFEASGDPAKAEAELEHLLADAPESPGLRGRIAALLLKLGRRDDALTIYLDEIQKGKPTPELRVAAGELALALQKTALAKDLAEKLIIEDPHIPGSVFILAKALRAESKLASSIQEFKRAITFDDRPVVHFEYARALVQVGKTDAALDELRKASSIPEAKVERGQLLFRNGDVVKAVGDLEEAVRVAPEIADAWLTLGNCYSRMGLDDKAEAAWRSAVKVKPDLAEARYYIGRLESERGRIGPALDNLRVIEGKVPDDVPWRADYFFQLAEAERLKGSKSAACAAYEKYLDVAAEKAPGRPEARARIRVLCHKG